MGQDATKQLRFSLSKLEIGPSQSGGTEPTTQYVDVGLVDDETLKITATPNARRDGGGQSIQTCDDIAFETSLMQVLDIDTVNDFRNVLCWVKATDKTSGTPQVVKLKNVYLNIAVALELYGKGKSAIKVTGTVWDEFSNVVTLPS